MKLLSNILLEKSVADQTTQAIGLGREFWGPSPSVISKKTLEHSITSKTLEHIICYIYKLMKRYALDFFWKTRSVTVPRFGFFFQDSWISPKIIFKPCTTMMAIQPIYTKAIHFSSVFAFHDDSHLSQSLIQVLT